MNMLCLFDHYFPYIGGAEIVHQKIAEHFARKHTVVVITRFLKKTVSQDETINNVRMVRKGQYFPRLFFSIIGFVYGRKYMKNSDLIFCSTYASALAGYFLAKKYNKKSILLVHEIIGNNWQYFGIFYMFHRWYEKYVVTRKFDQYIAVSQYTKQKLMEYGIQESLIQVIYNGIDENLFHPQKVDTTLQKKIRKDIPFLYMFYGRPGVSKGLEYLLQAIPFLAKKIPDSKCLLLIAQEPKRQYKKIKKLIQKLEIQHHIILHPSVERKELPTYINLADVVVIPSLTEGFGYTAVESAYLEKPLVVTTAGSLPEVSFGKVVFIQPRNVESLVQGIYKAYQKDYEYIPKKEFSWKKSLQEYDAVISHLVAS